MTTLWSGRFDGAPDPDAFEFGASFRFDRRLFDEDVTGSIAWARALGARRRPAARRSRSDRNQRSDEILERGRSDPPFVDGADEDIHSFVERAAGRADRRRRPAAAYRPLAQRAGVARSAPLPACGTSRCCSAASRRASPRWRNRRRSAGDALMPAFTHFRAAQPVLVAHFFLAHVAALRRDHERLAAARADADALTLGSGAIAGTSYDDRRARGSRAISASRASSPTASTPSSDRDFAATFQSTPARMTMVHLSRLAEDLDHPVRRRASLLRAVRRAQHRQQHDAAEEESRSAGARAREDGSLDRSPDGAADDDEGAAERLQQGSAGRQAGRLRRRRHARRLPGRGSRGRRRPDARPRARRSARRRACCWRPTSPTTWCGAGCRSGARTKSWEALVRKLVAEEREFESLSMKEWRAVQRPVRATTSPVTSRRAASVAAKRTPQSTAPERRRAARWRRSRTWLAGRPGRR